MPLNATELETIAVANEGVSIVRCPLPSQERSGIYLSTPAENPHEPIEGVLLTTKLEGRNSRDRVVFIPSKSLKLNTNDNLHLYYAVPDNAVLVTIPVI